MKSRRGNYVRQNTKCVNEFAHLYAHEYGFQTTNKKLSTYVALQSVVDNLTHALANGEHALGVYLDFSKALTIWYCGKSCIAMVFVVVLIIGSLVIWQTDQNWLLIMGSNLILIIINVLYQKFYTGTTFLSLTYL